MAITSKLTLPTIGLSAASALSLSRHISFFIYLASEQFYEDFKTQFTRTEVLERLQGLARIIITAKIYETYAPTSYERTFNLLNSFLAATDSEEELANITLYSDPSIAPALLLPEHSYAEFFDPQSTKQSFLLRTIGADAIRPFFNDLVALLEEELPGEAITAYEIAIRSRLPQ